MTDGDGPRTPQSEIALTHKSHNQVLSKELTTSVFQLLESFKKEVLSTAQMSMGFCCVNSGLVINE